MLKNRIRTSHQDFPRVSLPLPTSCRYRYCSYLEKVEKVKQLGMGRAVGVGVGVRVGTGAEICPEPEK